MERRQLKNGKKNPKYVDLLDEDKPIAGQKWACVSFISPDEILKKKELFFFSEFVKKWDMMKSVDKFTQFLNFVSYKHKIPIDSLISDFKGFVEEEKALLQKPTTFSDDYKTFLEHNEEELQKRFDKDNQFRTNTQGLKIRGCFPSQEEAQLRAKLLRETDPTHDISIGPVGVWIPWNPEAYKLGEVEYLEEELNQLMKEKKKNEAKAKQEFENYVKESKTKAMEENEAKAAKYNNKLSQTIDADGNLIERPLHAAKDQDHQDQDHQDQDVLTVDIQEELFGGNTVVMDKNTDHGLSQLVSGPFAKKVEKVEKVE
jgi:hypothetical protein